MPPADASDVRRPAEALNAGAKNDSPATENTMNRRRQHVLGLDDRQGDQLLCAADEVRTDEDKPVTPQEAVMAVERLLADDDAERVRDQLCPEANDDEPEEEIARDFLDQRDEARISHRLGRPFRF